MTLTVRLVVLAIAFLCGACATPSFTTVTTNGAGPLPRGTWGNAPISKTSRLFFGGLVNTNVNVFFNDTWVFTFLSKSSGIWTQLFPATVPSSRAFGYIASVEDENGNVFACMFGGVVFTSTSSTTSADKFYCYDVENQNWINYTSLGGPSARSGVSIVGDGPNLYVAFGINAAFQTQNDIWVFNINTLTWTDITPALVPPPRQIGNAAILCKDDDCEIVLYAGENITFTGTGFLISHLNDTWRFDISEQKWKDISSNDMPVPPRNNEDCFVATKNQKNAFLFGGDLPGNIPACTPGPGQSPENPTNELWRFRISQDDWNIVSTSNTPAGLKRHTCSRFKDDVYIFGGYGVVCVAGVNSRTFGVGVTRIKNL